MSASHAGNRLRVLALAASARRGSWNRKLIELAADIARERAQVVVAGLEQFSMPLYCGDFDQTGLPDGARELVRRVAEADALLISTPEYNAAIPAMLKNAIDWVSHHRPMPWRRKSIYLMAASTSAMGGIRGLSHARIPFEGCGALVFPDMFALARAHVAFDDRGRLEDQALQDRLRKEVTAFLRLVEAVAGGVAENEHRKAIVDVKHVRPKLPQ